MANNGLEEKIGDDIHSGSDEHVDPNVEGENRNEGAQDPNLGEKDVGKEDLDMVQHPHNDALVITLKIGKFQVRRILVDQGNSCDIMYVTCYKGLGLHLDDLEQSNNPMVGFNGTPTWSLGATNLEVQAGTKKVSTEFTVIDTPSPYNVILGRQWLHAIRVVPSTLHQLLRFPTEHGIEKVRGDQV
ncbi:uncharacterized protein LOC114319881 [Camellia sinensis]|uniref:uncharacterized protein LOC114319881 n=1 Tax=Camellia sinensis TaxID=4442 RepID=UPI001036BAB8|nr:uncharacterized protein LOC114319881 [Camellia sinensis]